MGLVLPYEEFFNTDLSRMLKQRQLPYSGTKAKMAARLAADDIRTVELRIEIYKHIPFYSPELRMRYCVDNIWGNMFDLNEWSLFRTCKQIHAESRPAFYQHCEFYFELFGPGCCKLALAWLESIGDVGRRNTRELTFDCYVSDTDTFLQDYVGPIHGKLTDAATVTYMGAPKAMWRFGRMFMGENAKVPLCEHCDNPGTTYDLAILEEPPEAFSEEDCDLAELKFCLGMLWFGPQAETPIACEGAAGEEGKADQT